MSPWEAYLDDIRFSFRKQKELAEKALRQVADDSFFRKPGEHSNSIAAVVKHVGGNLASRWTDFLTSDGDKPWRDGAPSSSSARKTPGPTSSPAGSEGGPPCSARWIASGKPTS